MLYVATEEIMLRGSYREPLYDSAPYVGSYSIDVSIKLQPDTVIELDEKGNVLYIYKEMSFGVSQHEGELNIKTNLQPLIDTKLKLISEVQFQTLEKQKEKREDWKRDSYNAEMALENNLEQYKELCKEIASVETLTQEKYENYSHRIKENAFFYVHNITQITKLRLQEPHINY